jgi:SAM-dependent methyltransferase
MSNTANVSTFAAGSAQYAAARPTYPAALFDWLAAQGPARDAAWDAGCGNGQATVALAARFARVVGNDSAAEQIAQAPRLPNIEYRVGAAEDVKFDDGSLDLVLAAQALHWFDLERFYATVTRALKPGGVFAALGYSWFRVDAALDARLREFLLKPLAPYWAQGNRELWSGYAGIAFPFAALEAPAFAIEVDWTLQQLLAYVATWSAAKRYRMEVGDDVTAPARALLAGQWGDGPRRVTMPLTLRVGRKASA